MKRIGAALFLILIYFSTFGQTEEIWNRQRAIFLFNFTQEIKWPNQFSTFNIAVLGENALHTEIQRLISSGRKVQGKNVRLVQLKEISEVSNVQLVYVDEKEGYEIGALINQVKGKGILIISENYPFNSSMINMVLVDGAFEFEIEQERIENEGFTLSIGLNRLAINSANRWQELYEKSYKSLEKERLKVKEQNEVIQGQEDLIINQEDAINNAKEEIKNINDELKSVELKNKEQQKLFAKKTEEIALLEKEYQQTKNDIIKKQDEIKVLDETLRSRQLEIKDKSKQIRNQNQTLKIQRRELNYQKAYTWLFVGITLLTLITGFVIWKNYREKKKSNIILEKKNKEIEATSDELRIVNKEMEQFAYLASHDLQEPLNTITSLIEFIDASKLDEQSQMSLDFIDKSTKRMRGLVKGLLAYSQLGSHVELELVDCNQLLSHVKENLNKVIIDKNAIIEIQELPVINGHYLKLSMLFQNLISNSLKFIKEGTTPEIHISVQKSKVAGYWEFCVQDNGIGISETALNKIFDIFHREHSKDKYEGTGIGLAHVKKIIELHKGEIWVKSKLGEGTSFYFTLLSS